MKDMNRRTSERRGQARLDYPEREGGNAKRNLGVVFAEKFRGLIAEPLENEVKDLRTEICQLRDAIQQINVYPHRSQCPVVDRLREHETKSQ